MTDKEREFQVAWYDYCIINRLIAYGEVPELTEEQRLREEIRQRERAEVDLNKAEVTLCKVD